MNPLIMERVYDAPIATVWKAISDKDHMKQWYFDVPEFRAEVGCEFRFIVNHEGRVYDHRCRVTDVVPGQRIAYTWRYEGHEGESLVVFELFAEGAKTRLKLTHSGLETFPQTGAFDRSNFVNGWTSLLGTELANYLATR